MRAVRIAEGTVREGRGVITLVGDAHLVVQQELKSPAGIVAAVGHGGHATEDVRCIRVSGGGYGCRGIGHEGLVAQRIVIDVLEDAAGIDQAGAAETVKGRDLAVGSAGDGAPGTRPGNRRSRSQGRGDGPEMIHAIVGIRSLVAPSVGLVGDGAGGVYHPVDGDGARPDLFGRDAAAIVLIEPVVIKRIGFAVEVAIAVVAVILPHAVTLNLRQVTLAIESAIDTLAGTLSAQYFILNQAHNILPGHAGKIGQIRGTGSLAGFTDDLWVKTSIVSNEVAIGCGVGRAVACDILTQ